MTQMQRCKFRFDYPDTIYDGFAHGSTWNGFDNVAVTKEVLDKIIADCEKDEIETGDDRSSVMFREIAPMVDGLYSLGWGFSTQIVRGSNWADIAALPVGTRVRFATSWDIFPITVVEEGTLATVYENEDGIMLVLPDDQALRELLSEWHGCVQFVFANEEPNDQAVIEPL